MSLAVQANSIYSGIYQSMNTDKLKNTEEDFSSFILSKADDKGSNEEKPQKVERVKPDYMPYAGSHVVKNKNEYFAMAKDGMIAYQGAVFICDRLTDTLTLGDVSSPNDCIRVGLAKGGSLFFNRDDAGSLMNAITMFSPEDQERIVKAIQIDNMAQKAKKEVEDAKSGENIKLAGEAETDTETDSETQTDRIDKTHVTYTDSEKPDDEII